ncbi:MAG: prepilin-type N-terminal cleavage/methylation domain-containing protein, partial [Phycisphaeraceae bacterium]
MGFSLVELVMVVVIVGVVGAMALPRFAEATARQQLDAAAERVTDDLNKARHRARASSSTLTLTFDIDAERYVFNNAGGSATIIELDEAPY